MLPLLLEKAMKSSLTIKDSVFEKKVEKKLQHIILKKSKIINMI